VVSGRRAARRRRLLPRGYGFAIAGIAVGMAGLVALGALADRISRFIDGGHRFVLGQISVAGAGIGTGAGRRLARPWAWDGGGLRHCS
jgi:hypothetical protein